jgi:hypothetical protein
MQWHNLLRNINDRHVCCRVEHAIVDADLADYAQSATVLRSIQAPSLAANSEIEV